MARTKELTIEQKLQQKITHIEAEILRQQELLELAKKNLANYLANKETIESILEIHLAADISKPSASKRGRKSKAELEEVKAKAGAKAADEAAKVKVKRETKPQKA